MSFDHIPADGRVHVESLDARGAWPPLLRPGVLAGHGAYGQWESRLISQFLTSAERETDGLAPALVRLLCWTDSLRAWKPADGALEVLVSRPPPDVGTRRLVNLAGGDGALQDVLTSLLSEVPRQWRPGAWPAGLTDATDEGPPVTRTAADAALARYLATRLVGSWVAYQGQGLRSVAASLVSAYVLSVMALAATANARATAVTLGRLTSAIRASDWLLLHLLDRDVWAAWCGGYESDTDARPLLALVGAAARVLDSLHWRP